MNAKPAETFTIGDQTFVVHLYTASQAFDVLLALGEALSGPLSRILNRKVSGDLSDLASAMDELDQEMTAGAMLALFGSIRSSGGMGLVCTILQTTYYQDKPINTRERFDEVFQGPGALIDAARVLWHVLRFQMSPLLAALRPLFSERGGALETFLQNTLDRT